MSLKEKLSAIEVVAAQSNPTERLLNQLDAETREALQRLLLSDVSTRKIHDALKDEGYKIGRDTLAAYRSRLKKAAA